MSRYVDVEKLWCDSCNRKNYCSDEVCEVKAMPAEDVEPIIHAHWIHIKGVTPCCSNCGCTIEEKYIGYMCCPSCGAHMDEKVGE